MFFSIITICFNSERTIERTIRSVLTQTFTDYEYIIVDGGSKDSTLDIVKKYEPLFKGRMKWRSEPDRGIYDAMNKGIMRSSGIIIGIVNSDDWLEPEALAYVYRKFEDNGKREDVIYAGDMYFHHRNGKKSVLKASLKKLAQYAKIGDIAGIRHPATFVPMKLYDKYGMFDIRMKISADADFLLRIFRAAGVDGYVLINQCVTNMSDCGTSNTLSLDFISNKMLPDRKYLMGNMNFSSLKQIFCISIWYIKMIVKVLLSNIGAFHVR